MIKMIIALITFCLVFALITQITRLWIEARIPRDGEVLEINGTELHYRDLGHGQPIVLIHGLSGQMRNFAPTLVDQLAVGHRVIMIDRPGSGYSAPLVGARNTLAGQADVISGLIAALDLDMPLIVGHSLGGAVALNLALDHPDQVGVLALIAPVTQPRAVASSSAFTAMSINSDGLRRFVSLTFATPLGLFIFNRSARSVFAPEAMPDDFGIAGGSMLAIRPTSYFFAGSDMVALRETLPDMAARYPSLQMPVGILFGTADQVVSPAQHGGPLRDAVAGATLTQIAGGHMIIYTSPDAVTDWILDQEGQRKSH